MKHLKTKADISSAKEMKNILTEMFNNDDPCEFEEEVAIALLYYRLLQINEVLQITIENVNLTMSENIEADSPHPIKRTAKGFIFTIPSWLKPTFKKIC